MNRRQIHFKKKENVYNVYEMHVMETLSTYLYKRIGIKHHHFVQ